MDFILKNLAIGNYQEALQPSSDVNALLCVAKEKTLYDTSYKYYKVPIEDMQPIPAAQMKEAVEWIEQNIDDNKIMLFCNAGIGRSPSVAVGYLCCMLGYSFGQAVEYVAIRRPCMSILPNLMQTIEETKEQLRTKR